MQPRVHLFGRYACLVQGMCAGSMACVPGPGHVCQVQGISCRVRGSISTFATTRVSCPHQGINHDFNSASADVAEAQAQLQQYLKEVCVYEWIGGCVCVCVL